ncbi:amidohydrolase [Urechidicola sp. KH5]
MKSIIYVALTLLIWSCASKEEVDLIVTNGNIYTINDTFESAEAFAVKNGKFIAVGSVKQIQSNYSTSKLIDAKGKAIFPGLIDGHCHFYGLGTNMLAVDLMGTNSYAQILERVQNFQKERQVSYIYGRGWDQNDWELKEFPTKKELDALFPNTPVALERVDGHAIIANQAALDLASVSNDFEIAGGEVIRSNGQLTGVLLDAAADYVLAKRPEFTTTEKIAALKQAERECFSYGLTTVTDAGLDRSVIELIDSLQQINELKMRVYAMVSGTTKNLDYYLEKGLYKTERLNVRSFKIYGDGALGSRGATLRKPYSDRAHHHGTLSNSIEFFETTAKRIAKSKFQMNTHAIGDSTNHLLLDIYKRELEGQTNRRWRIEHAQIVSPEDFESFKNVIPSVQPTHATSDMYWAEDRLGAERLKGGYAFKDLLKQHGKITLGTDFPVEYVNPFLTFYAATARQDTKGYPEGGFQIENALTREETIKGMTVWAAYANFEENEKGSIEVGKFADFTILENNLMEVDLKIIPDTKVIATYVNGEKVY